MNYANSINAEGLNLIIQNIASRLEALTWLVDIYGRAYDFKSDKNKILPYFYLNNGDYVNVLPNDAVYSQCFFRAKGNETIRFDTDKGSRRKERTKFERNLSLIVWVNLEFLDYSGNVDYIYTENLKVEVMNVLKCCTDISKITAYYDEDTKKVFEGYDLDDINRKFMTYPFDAFRIDFTVSYHQEC